MLDQACAALAAWPTQLPGLIGALLPIAVWARDARFGPSFLWTVPVDRRRHALIKVLARRGEFRLDPLPGGRTRLEGTTWYRHRIWPAEYWQVWSDAIIHRVHRRVLAHIKKSAEAETGAVAIRR